MYVGAIHTSVLLLVYIQPQRVIGATVYVSCADDFPPRLSSVVLVFFFKNVVSIRVCGPSPMIAFGLPRLENIYLYMKCLSPSTRGANAEEHIKTRIQCLCFCAKCIYVEDDLSIPFQPFSRDRVPEPPDRMRQSPRPGCITCSTSKKKTVVHPSRK
jgi:hypothetical protein